MGETGTGVKPKRIVVIMMIFRLALGPGVMV